MNTKHTKWKVSDIDSTYIRSEDGEWIATTCWGSQSYRTKKTRPIKIKRAKLIVEAHNSYYKNQETIKELLEALKKSRERLISLYAFMKMTECSGIKYNETKEEQEEFIKLEKSIAKAESK